jgi:signal transduction histidine kinase
MFSRPIEIALIEDNSADAELTREVFSAGKRSIRLHILKSAEEALLFLSRVAPFADAPRPDLIVLDLNLPGMDGRELLRTIKNDRLLSPIPVVVLTMSDTDLDVRRSYSLGASCHIVKPTDPAAFARVVRAIEDFWCSTVSLSAGGHGRSEAFADAAASTNVPEKALGATIHALCVEDSDEDFDLVSQNLDSLTEPRFTSYRARRLSEALTYLESHAVDVVLLDLSLPDSVAAETLVRFRAQAPQLPVVVLTGAEGKLQGVLSVQEGADDYLVKSQFQSDLLGRTLLHAIERKKIVLARLAALTSERDARNEAEHAVGIRDEFLSIASHELRNPLAAMRYGMQALIEMLNGGQRDAVFDTRIQSLARNTDREINLFSKLIDTLLDFSSIRSGRLRLALSRFDVNDLVRDSVERLASELESTGCRPVLTLGPPALGDWDRVRLEQVLVNLLSNAMKYAPGKPLAISASSDAETVWIRVKDQGPGVAPQDRESIFRRFERSSASTTGYVQGLGLGLYVARQIIDTHGGGITVESEPGVGSTFIVRLPRAASAATVVAGS